MTEVTGAVYDGAWVKGLKHGEGTADNSVTPPPPIQLSGCLLFA